MGSPMEIKNLYPDEELRKSLFISAMNGEWSKVVAKCQENAEYCVEPITISKDTALHLAVLDGKDDVVEELVNLMKNRDANKVKKALEVANVKKNTALHLAAAEGNARMCNCIAQIEPSLIGKRNEDGETPLFSAAVHGNKDTFFCLHEICLSTQALLTQAYSYYRRSSDGETIIHVAIAREHYDLAFQMICYHKELAIARNQKGITPLHILASKTNAFRSGTHLTDFRKMIYNCIFVEELEEPKEKDTRNKAPNNDKNLKCPQNYVTCKNFLQLMMKGYNFALDLLSKLKLENLRDCLKDQPPPGDAENQRGNESKDGVRSRQLVPSNYDTCFDLFRFLSRGMLIVLGFVSSEIKKLRDKKERHTWSVQILDKLIQVTETYEYKDTGKRPRQDFGDDSPYSLISFAESGEAIIKNLEEPQEKGNGDKVQGNLPQNTPDQTGNVETSISVPENESVIKMLRKTIEDLNLDKKVVILVATDKPKTSEMAEKETPILIAAKNGITEIVEKILEKFPVAILDMNSEEKNVVLLAVENRQPHVYQLLLERKVMKDSIFRKLDDKGNSALHLAATIEDSTPWRIPGAALQMQWEIKWYEYVKHSMPDHFFIGHNNDNKTPKDIFTKTHKDLVKSGGEWLKNTSESCSVVAALIATVAFATAATVPGGVDENSGRPTLEKYPAFNAFAISSVVALCFSVTSVVMFLAILTSRYVVHDFKTSLPRKLSLGLTSLFVSIAAILVSFCTGHFFVFKDELRYAALPIYAVTCLPVTLFAMAQFRLYIDLVWVIFRKVP